MIYVATDSACTYVCSFSLRLISLIHPNHVRDPRVRIIAHIGACILARAFTLVGGFPVHASLLETRIHHRVAEFGDPP